jgi:hypothetical protein
MDRQFAVGPKTHVVSNGYDPEDLAGVARHDFGHFAIVYTGSLWPPTRSITPLMAALRRLDGIAPGRNWMFHYYGRHGDHVRKEARRFEITERVLVHDMVPRAAALEAVKGAGVAVVITSAERNARAEDNGMVTGKIFEAIGLRTPVVLIAPDGSDAKLVVETTGLGRSYSPDDADGIAGFLKDSMDGKSVVSKDPDSYAWGNLVSTLDAVLRDTVGDR